MILIDSEFDSDSALQSMESQRSRRAKTRKVIGRGVED